MKQNTFAALSPLPLTLVAAACGGLDPSAAAPAVTASPPPPAPTAGNVGLGVLPDRTPAEIAALRDRGRPALAELLAAYDRLTDRGARSALAATIDLVAGQRYATVSRLYWYTDLDAARAEARTTGKPILSLRMLGRLDQDLSCANSRMFRTILYPDPSIAALLRDRFVLHWSSEREVPRVTIDFGDGRTLERTVTGNSIHYVLDADGTPIDALPGLYAPSVFRAELERSLELHRSLAHAPGRIARTLLIQRYHAGRVVELAKTWQSLAGEITYDIGEGRVLRGGEADDALALAQRATMSKAMMEAPELARLDIGSDPGALLPDVDTWSTIGQAVFGFAAAKAPEPAAPYNVRLGARTVTARRRGRAAPGSRTFGILSAPARALIAQVMQRTATAPGAAAPSIDDVIAQLERSVIADTAIAELQLRRQLHERMAITGPLADFDELDRYVYDELFHTPASDPWLGLLPGDVYTGLPGDGVVIQR